MRRIGALPAPRLQHSLLDQPRHEQVQDTGMHAVLDQPGTELRQDRVVEAGVSKSQAQSILPRNLVPNRLRGLPIGQVLRRLEHRDQHQAPG